jgi:hypothetical protein
MPPLAAVPADCRSLRLAPSINLCRNSRATSVPRRQHQQRRQGSWRRSAAAEEGSSGSGEAVGLIIECDGAIVDAHVEGHRVAFNRAFSVSGHPRVCAVPCRWFVSAPAPTDAAGCRSVLLPSWQRCLSRCAPYLQEIGHDCTSWTPAVFYDLMRMGDGTGEASCWRVGGRTPPHLCCSLWVVAAAVPVSHRLTLRLCHSAPGEGLIAAYYSIAGWPMMLASSERGAFLKKVHALKVGAGPARGMCTPAPRSAASQEFCAPQLELGLAACRPVSA